jgi:hypothetical protein
MILWLAAPEFLSDAELREEYCASEGEAGGPKAIDQRLDELAAEIERRHLDI